MDRPDQRLPPGSRGDQADPHQRRCRQVDRPGPVTVGDTLDAFTGCAHDVEFEVHGGRDDGHELTRAGCDHGGPQVREPHQHPVQSLLQAGRVDLTIDLQHGLGDVDVNGITAEQRLEHQPLLERRQRLDVGQLPVTGLPLVDIALAEAGQREVGGRTPHPGAAERVVTQPGQRLRPELGQFLHVRLVHDAGRELEGPVQNQAVGTGDRRDVDVDDGGQWQFGRGVAAESDVFPVLLLGRSAPELAEVVEGDLRNIAVYLGQQTVADASVGHLAQLLLDP